LKDIIEMIKTRRSIREYKDDPLSDDDIKFRIDCARYAPFGSMQQPWSFMVITNKEVMQRLSESGKKAMISFIEPFKNTSKQVYDYLVSLRDIFYNAPVLIIVFGNKNIPSTVIDCSMAAQNMMLAAHSKGIGSCWIGNAIPALMDEEILKELDAPAGYKAVAPLIFGYPKGKIIMPERIEPEVKWLR
jgi:nitroreductase